jgi:hypothetical protein
MNARAIERLMRDTGIIRHRDKDLRRRGFGFVQRDLNP